MPRAASDAMRPIEIVVFPEDFQAAESRMPDMGCQPPPSAAGASIPRGTSYYNPFKGQRRRRNYSIFRAHLGVPLVTVEWAPDGQFELGPADDSHAAPVTHPAELKESISGNRDEDVKRW